VDPLSHSSAPAGSPFTVRSHELHLALNEEGTEFFRGGMTDQRRSALIGQTANGRAGTAEDIAATVLFLASPGASHITGQTIHVNGGALSRV
jgi:NAD(P)-dependent dehydrogenase (short-subunit alcohol dehydrogenase family)